MWAFYSFSMKANRRKDTRKFTSVSCLNKVER